MIDNLKNKILSWTPEISNQFHNNIQRYGDNANKVWEVVDNGFYIYSSDCAIFYNNSGTSYHLQTGNLQDQLNLIKQISSLVDQHNLIKVVHLNNIQQISIYRLEFTYWEETVPYNTHGIDFTSLLLVDKMQQPRVTLEFIKNLIVGIDQLISTIDNLQPNSNCYPLEIQTANFFYDTTEQKYFWRSNFILTAPRQQSIDVALRAINGLDGYLQSCLKINIPNFIEEIHNHMREKCRILKP